MTESKYINNLIVFQAFLNNYGENNKDDEKFEDLAEKRFDCEKKGFSNMSKNKYLMTQKKI